MRIWLRGWRRQGREWSDGSGNFMGSTIVRPAPGDPPGASLSLLAGVAVYEAVLSHCPLPSELRLKWPNDLLLLGAKLAGILLQREGDIIVVGIGVNLANAPLELGRETMAMAQLGPAPDRDLFAAALAASFIDELARWRRSGLKPLLARWQAAAHPRGTPIACHEPGGGRISGTFDGLESDGSLRLRLADGTRRVIHAGDVMLEGG
jgi:BirA family transcriptional regulator, biotin operon repressor / biotin---[acetyl-CoA-carboxylase] ligase